MTASVYQDIKNHLRELYLEDDRPWLVGFSGGKDSTMVASLVLEAVLSIQAEKRKKPIAVLCTDTRVEIPAIVEMVESALARMNKFSRQNGLNVEVNLLKPPPEQSSLGEYHRARLPTAQSQERALAVRSRALVADRRVQSHHCRWSVRRSRS